MAREIDLSKGVENLSKSDLEYLRDRGRLTPEQEEQYLGDSKPEAPTARSLDETPNTGDTGPEPDDGGAGGDADDYEELAPEDYESSSNERLREELRYRELSTSGNKQELIERLEQDDEDEGE